MCNHDDKSLGGNLLDKLHDLHACHGVKRARRLVRQKDFGVVYKCAGDCDTLALSARELVWLLVILVCKANTVKCALRTLDTLLLADARDGEGKLYIAKHGLVRDEVIALEDKSDTVVAVNVPVAVGVKLGADAAYNEVAVGVVVKSADDVKHRCLSASRGSEDGDKLAFSEGN